MLFRCNGGEVNDHVTEETMTRHSQTRFLARIGTLCAVLAPMALAGCDSTKHDEQNTGLASMAQATPQPPKPDCDMPDTNCQHQSF